MCKKNKYCDDNIRNLNNIPGAQKLYTVKII